MTWGYIGIFFISLFSARFKTTNSIKEPAAHFTFSVIRNLRKKQKNFYKINICRSDLKVKLKIVSAKKSQIGASL